MPSETAEAEQPETTRDREPKALAARLEKSFYGSAVAEAERLKFEAAEKIEGFDKEIAILRTKLRDQLEERSEDLPLMLRGIDMLVKAVSARYRLSKTSKDELAKSLDDLLRDFGGQLKAEAAADE